MGNINDSNKKFLQEWVQLEKQGSPGTFTNVWIQKKGNKKIQMVEYPLHVSSEEDIEQQREIFWLRLNHRQLVSSMYFLDETKSEFCSSNYQGNIFIERIPLTLQTVTDVPFPDALHIYEQSLVGFHILASEIVKSCFPISQEHIGINCEAVCKVWMNPRYEKNFPSRNERIHEHVMVRMILQTIEENVDLGSIEGIPSPMTYIYSKSRSPSEVRFDQAITLFQNYTKEHFKGQVPTKLDCVDRVGGVYTLSKNWKNRYDSLQTAVRNHDPELVMSGLKQQQANSSSQLNGNAIGNVVQFGETNNYTAFRREEPTLQTVGQENQYEAIRGSTPSFSKNAEGSFFTASKVQSPPVIINQQIQPQQQPQVQFQQSRVIQQVVYQNPSEVPTQIIRTFSQKQIVGSVVRMPIENGVVVNNFGNTQRSEVKESFIQNRVVNNQVNVPQQPTVFIQQLPPQPQIVQQIPPQTIQQLIPQQILQQQINQQVPLQQQQVPTVVNPQQQINQQIPPQVNNQQNRQYLPRIQHVPLQVVQQQGPPQPIVLMPRFGPQVIPENRENFQQFNTPQPQYNQNFINSQGANVRLQPVPLNLAIQQGLIPNQQSQSQVNNVQQIQNQQPVPVQQVNIVRRSNVAFGSQIVPQQQIIPPQQIQQQIPLQQIIPQQQVIPTPYQVAKTTSVYATPQGVTKVETQRIESRNEIIERQQINRVQVGSDQLNLRLRNNEQSISSINPQTNQVQSNEQISDKFSMMKQQPIDTSTRNFYNNMMDGADNTQKQQGNNDYFSSYYANYTSKLYDNSEVAEVQSPLNKLLTKKDDRESNQAGNKYKVTLDDGMSSADFLNQLKNIKSSSTASPFLKTEANYDYGLTNKYASDSNSDDVYKFDYKNFTTKLTNDTNPQKDLNVVVDKLTITPASNMQDFLLQQSVNSSQKEQYNINYQHQQGQNDAGNLNYEAERVQVSGNDGSYAEEYYQSGTYQSTFDKYAAFDKYQTQVPISIEQNDFKLGDNLQTQFSRNNTDDAQYFEATKNTVNNTSYANYSPMQQKSEEQYQVEYDPEILADLQRLKGAY